MSMALSNLLWELGIGGMDIPYVWRQTTPEGKAIVIILLVFSIFAWAVMWNKAIEIRRAKRLNTAFLKEFRRTRRVFDMFEQKIEVEGCPLFSVYRDGCKELEQRLEQAVEIENSTTKTSKILEYVARVLERSVAEQALKLESGLVFLALAVSGAPFLGLLGTVWGVMNAFSGVAQAVAAGNRADLAAMAPGVAGALITTVAGLLVAIPSMFGYNWLVHNVRILTVQLDNFAQELLSRIELELPNK